MQSYLDSPQYQALVAQVLQGQSGSRSPAEAIAKGLGGLADAWVLKKMEDKGKKQQADYGNTIANAVHNEYDYDQTPSRDTVMARLLGSGNSDVVNDVSQMALAQALQPQQPFTLNEGSVRYGPDGKVVANNPKPTPPPAPFTLSPGATRFSPDGKPIASLPEKEPPPQPFTLTPGATRFGPDGKPLASLPDKPNQGPNETWNNPVPETGPDGKPILVRYSNLGNRQVVEGAKPVTPTPTRQMQPKAINDLSDAGAQTAAMDRLSGGFKPEYGGHTVLGGLSNTIGRLTGDPTGQTQWWQDYQVQLNQMRNKLFGAALTAQEKSEFEKAVINPRMSPDEIQKNLKRQDELAYAAARKLAKAYIGAGYPKDAVEGALGVNLDQLETVAPPDASGYTQPPPGGSAGALPQGVTEEDLQHTMKLHNLSREEVLRRLGGGK